jgi:hypothetical protein
MLDERFFTIWSVVDEQNEGPTPPEQNALIQNDGDFITQTDGSLILILE